jgi:hypothetical protein
MLTAILVLCLVGAAICVVGVILHVRVLRRLEHLALEVDRHIMPYLARHADTLQLQVTRTSQARTPESLIVDACNLADDLLDLERKAEDLALGPTQNLPVTGSRPGGGAPTGAQP